ncbi:hypothetical protein VSU01S_31000 [Vibrio superstes NBRC 103154]|uniref:Uncharacterized protein n=1 Tax=Vibrio superstes NBRC 103154 TaxID=1219062 RepID=A0A511QU14_9VIBR|nr:hypothetical protein VSU01S_31000 [Vibrio superstes NBRC 103154]
MEYQGNNKLFGSPLSRVKDEEEKRKEKVFKKLNRLYRKRQYSDYIKLLNSHSLWVEEEKKSKYYSWAALIVKGSDDSKYYIGEAVNLHPIAINDITTSIVISEYHDKQEILSYLRKKALHSPQLKALTFCYVLAKFDEQPYLNKLIEKPYFTACLNNEEILEVYSLLGNSKRVIDVYQSTQSNILSIKSYERIYDAYTRERCFETAEKVFFEADRIHAPLKSTISKLINPNAINNKLERHFWFAKGDLIKAYRTYKRQRLSQVMYVRFDQRYTQSLEQISRAKSPIVFASWGPGDEIRFSGLYHILSQVNSNITIACEPRLFELFSELFPKIRFYPVDRTRRVDERNATKYNKLPDAKLHHLMDNAIYSQLARFDKVTILTDIISDIFSQYLKDNKRTSIKLSANLVNKEIQNEIANLRLQGKRLIGISWRSTIETTGRNEHYYSTRELSPIFELKDTIFVNLQYDDCSSEMKDIILAPGSEFVTLDIDQFNDFSTVLYIMQNLDVVISAATTVFELAGLSGVDTYALTNHHALSSRVVANNEDLWFKNIKYINNMTNLTKKDLVDRIADEIEANYGLN